MFSSMWRRPNSITSLALLFAAATSSGGEADPKRGKPGVEAEAVGSAASALTFLQRSHAKDASTFVLQRKLDCLIQDGGGGGCASAAGVDLLQALRVMAGLDKLPNPHKAALSAFADQKELLKGRVTNAQLVGLIRFYGGQLEPAKISVRVESAPTSAHREGGPEWPEARGPDLSMVPMTVRILSYTASDTKGQMLGRHFVLLKGESKGQIVVVDPRSPVDDRRFILEHRAGDKGVPARIFLLNPAGVPRPQDLAYELNTVFTVSVATGAGVERETKPGSASVESINRKIDDTAAHLRGTKGYLDPRLWREKTASFGLPGLDLPAEYGGSGWPAAKMIEVFKHLGAHNLNFRDVWEAATSGPC